MYRSFSWVCYQAPGSRLFNILSEFKDHSEYLCWIDEFLLKYDWEKMVTHFNRDTSHFDSLALVIFRRVILVRRMPCINTFLQIRQNPITACPVVKHMAVHLEMIAFYLYQIFWNTCIQILGASRSSVWGGGDPHWLWHSGPNMSSRYGRYHTYLTE